MADLRFILSKINALPTEMRPVMTEIVTEILKQMRIGHPTGDGMKDPLTNFAGCFLHATTPANAGDEFTIAHALGRAPYLALPALRLDAVGSSVVPLTVARAADERRVYFTSTQESAPVTLVVEG